ncbi:MAG: N-acetyltransferase family protein [Pseudomonadota bacterium]
MQIRRAQPSDAAFIADTYRPFVMGTSISFETTAPDASDIQTRMHAAGDSYPWLIAENDGMQLGYAYASQHRTRAAYATSVDTAIYLDDMARGQGVALALYSALFRVLSAQHFVMAFAGVTLPNPASEAFHRKAGFEQIAQYPNVGFKYGAWRDVVWFARALDDAVNPPSPILSLNEIDVMAEIRTDDRSKQRAR